MDLEFNMEPQVGNMYQADQVLTMYQVDQVLNTFQVDQVPIMLQLERPIDDLQLLLDIHWIKYHS